MMYVREHMENFLANLIGQELQDKVFDHNPTWLGYSFDIDLPEGDELFRFDVLVDDGGEDLLVVADGVIDHDFELILNIL